MYIVCLQVLVKLIKPYTRISLQFIAKELNIDESEVEQLLVQCILDNQVRGRIDQPNRTLIIERQENVRRYAAVEKWATQLASLHNALVAKVP